MSGMAVEVEVEVVQPMILPQRSKVAWADFHMVPNSDCQYGQYMDLMAFNGRDHQPELVGCLFHTSFGGSPRG